MEKMMDIFIGRLGRDPELMYTPKGKPVCYLSVAINKENEEKPIWKKVIVWERQAELCSVQLRKGAEIFVHGISQLKEFTTKEGLKKTFEEVNARLVGFTNI